MAVGPSTPPFHTLGIGLIGAGFSIPQVFLVGALLNAVVAVYIFGLVPEFLMRFLAWLLIHTMYRVRSEGLERIPEQGGCIVVCNHVSYVDAVVLADGRRVPREHRRHARRVGDDLRVDLRLADAPGDELGVLRAEVDDEDGTLGRLGLFGHRVPSEAGTVDDADAAAAASRSAR